MDVSEITINFLMFKYNIANIFMNAVHVWIIIHYRTHFTLVEQSYINITQGIHHTDAKGKIKTLHKPPNTEL